MQDYISNVVTLGSVGTTSFIIILLILVCNWKIFLKANVPGWMSLIPILNVYKLFEIARGNGWKMLFMFIPFFNIIYGVLTIYKLSKAFGYDILLTLLYFIAPPVAMLILAFGNNDYYGPY